MHLAICALSIAAVGQVDVDYPPGVEAVPYGIRQPAGPELIPATPAEPERLRVRRTFAWPRAYTSSFQPPPVPPGAEVLPPGQILMPPGESVEEIELFKCVTVEDRRNIAPCAVPTILKVRDPCDKCCGKRDCCCEKKYVFVEVCAPECDCPKVRETRCGFKVTYDYGKYRIQLTSRPRRGEVHIDYDD